MNSRAVPLSVYKDAVCDHCIDGGFKHLNISRMVLKQNATETIHSLSMDSNKNSISKDFAARKRKSMRDYTGRFERKAKYHINN